MDQDKDKTKQAFCARFVLICICSYMYTSPLDKFWYCRLSPNHKVLHYGDIEEFSQGQISHDSLQEKGGQHTF